MKRLSRMTEAELWAFWERYRRVGRQGAAELIGRSTRAGYVKAARALANYACNWAVMKACRRRKDKLGVRIYTHCADVSLQDIDLNLISYLL